MLMVEIKQDLVAALILLLDLLVLEVTTRQPRQPLPFTTIHQI